MDISGRAHTDKKRLVSSWRVKLHEIIFEAETKAGKIFDVGLLWAILFSIVVVMLESVHSIQAEIGGMLRIAEWVLTILFTLEYLARIASVGRPLRYVFSFLGIVDFLAVVPTYLSLVVEGSQYLLVIRAIRLLRVFRIFKLSRYMGEGEALVTALKASRPKITVFLGAVMSVVVIMGTVMYLIEGEANGFTSIPRSIYWAIVTLTTVGYGDIAPATILGQTVASVIMILGYSIIAVPTGIVSAEFAKADKATQQHSRSYDVCPSCLSEGHDNDAIFCKRCGSRLNY